MNLTKIPRCAECKWWLRNEKVGKSWGLCLKSNATIGIAQHPLYRIQVRENFGCVNWEHKEGQEHG